MLKLTLKLYSAAQVGHTKGYIQVLVIAPDSMLGTSADVKITSVGRWSVFGEVIEGSVVVEAPKQTSSEPQKEHSQNQVEEAGCCGTNSCGTCACSDPVQHCSPERCDNTPNAPQTIGDVNCEEAIQPTLVRRNVEGSTKASKNSAVARSVGQEQEVNLVTRRGVDVDTILWCGLAVSFAATVALIVLLTSKISSTSS
jgi:threonylcarbamoyladenosine tRNA methylthiotransferase CDKAL1